jgi:CTP synthase
VQFIPHVTGEIKNFLRELAVKDNPDIVLVEVGGTIGDLENSYFIEAMREMRYDEGKDNVVFINVTYIIEPSTLGEFKSKAAQIGIRQLMGLGVQPDIIICRSQHPVTQKVKEKISISADIPVDHVYNLYDIKNVYEIPLMLKEMGIDKSIFKVLNISQKENKDKVLNIRNWREFVNKMNGAHREVTIALVGKYTNVHDSYLSVIKALEHSGPYVGVKPSIKWVEATDIEDGKVKLAEVFEGVDSLIVPGGFGTRGVEGKIAAIKYARENNITYLGLCYGMQLAVVEFARNACGLKGANTTEVDPKTKYPVIDIIPEQEERLKKAEIGGTMRLGDYPAKLKKGSLAHKLYGQETVYERHRHRFELIPSFEKILEKNGMLISGVWPKKNLAEFVEIPSHKYFIASQAHLEMTSRPLRPHPLFVGLLKACV